MTIEELIQRLRYDREIDMDINDLAEPIAGLLEELQWYRSQDLIGREDVHCMLSLSNRSNDYHIDHMIDRIPKAEPPYIPKENE